MELHNQVRKLQATRKEILSLKELADDLSREIAHRLHTYMKECGTTFEVVAKRAGLTQHALVNWVVGNQTHRIPCEIVMKIWNATTPTPTQKFSYSHQMKKLPIEGWNNSDKEIARQIGCSKFSVRRFRLENRKPKFTFDETTDWEKPNQDIAKDAGCCERTVRNARRARSLPRAPSKERKRGWADVALENVSNPQWENLTNEAIAQLRACSKTSVREYRIKNNKPKRRK